MHPDADPQPAGFGLAVLLMRGGRSRGQKPSVDAAGDTEVDGRAGDFSEVGANQTGSAQRPVIAVAMARRSVVSSTITEEMNTR